MTLGFLFVRLPALEEFERSEVVERLVGADGVVDVFPATELGTELRDVPAIRDHLIELLVVRAMGAFDLPVKLGRARWEDEERQVSLLASDFEFGSEFAAAIHLQGGDGERHAIDQRVQEASRGQRSGAFVHFQHIPTRDHVAGREVFQYHAARRSHLFGVDLHQITRPSNRPKMGFSPGPGTAAHFAAPPDRSFRPSFHQHAAALQVVQDPAHHGRGKPNVFAAQQHDQFVLPPAGILASQSENGFALRGCPGRLAMPMRAMRTILQRGEVMRIVAPPPAIERLPADPKVAAGKSRIAAMTQIMTHPGQPELTNPAQLAPKTRKLARSGHLPSSYLHGDTLPSVTNHSEREHVLDFAFVHACGPQSDSGSGMLSLLSTYYLDRCGTKCEVSFSIRGGSVPSPQREAPIAAPRSRSRSRQLHFWVTDLDYDFISLIAAENDADYECPFCGQFERDTLPGVLKDYVQTGKVKFVYRDFPPHHPHAMLAARASRCAGDQGKYWKMHDALFTSQANLAEDHLSELAGSLDIDSTKFANCLAGHKFTGAIQDSVSQANDLGIHATPSFIIGTL